MQDPRRNNHVLKLEVDSIGAIFDVVESQLLSPHPVNIALGRNGNLFTIIVFQADEDGRLGDVRP